MYHEKSALSGARAVASCTRKAMGSCYQFRGFSDTFMKWLKFGLSALAVLLAV